jgi:hypothetical protein
MVYKIGSEGKVVGDIQKIVAAKVDNIFGKQTEQYVKLYQANHGLKIDGIVGEKTLQSMGLTYECTDCLINSQHFMPTSEYFRGPVPKNWIIWHHTAGWDNPYSTIDMWANDRRAKVGTEYVIGGQHPLNGQIKYDGLVVQAFPEGGYAWHTGTGMTNHHIQSIGVEICSIGCLTKGKTYVNTDVNSNQICTLDKPFRGFSQFHKYSEKQLQSLKILTLQLADKYDIDLHEGLYKWVKEKGADGFNRIDGGYVERHKGLYTHTNLTSQKTDCFPQPELIDMLLSL